MHSCCPNHSVGNKMTSLARYQELKMWEGAFDRANRGDSAQAIYRKAEKLREELLEDINAALKPTGYTLEEIVKADLI